MNKPFAVKGFNVVSPKGSALWCKAKEPDYTFNAKGDFLCSLVCDPGEPAVKEFISKLEELRDIAYDETIETQGEKGKDVKKRPVYSKDFNKEGTATGNIVFKFKLGNVSEREPGQDKITVVDAHKNVLNDIPLVSNGSTIRCVAYANPYYMASSKEIGISLMWKKLQIIDLIEYGSGSDFDEEDGFVSDDSVADLGGDVVDF